MAKMPKSFDTSKLCIHGIFLLFFVSFNRTDAAWTFDNKPIIEGPIDDLEVLVTTITSDNKTTANYDITGDYTNEFTIDRKSGQIYQVFELDREMKAEYLITASAADVNGNPSEIPVSFTITVLDVIDNSPVFDKSTLTATVDESHPSGVDSKPFMRIVATDADEGFNGQIIYSIQEDSDSPPSLSGGRFTIEPITGYVKLTGYLDYETYPVVRFNVVATDGGGETNRITKKTTSQVIVHVLDSNDHAPEFGTLYDTALSELSQVGIPLYYIYATDKDEDVNKKVYFEITDGNIGGTFDIVSKPFDTVESVSYLLLAKELNFESGVTNFLLSIKAFNKDASNAGDDAYSTTETLTITVVDENEPPTFIHIPYSTVINEGPAPIEPIPIISVYAEDLDFGTNQTVTYSFINHIPGFTIDSNTGVILVDGAVDREATLVIDGFYRLQVVAIDNYDNGPRASTIVTVDIVINDVNDNAPILDWDPNKEIIICEKPGNETIAVLNVTDLDSTENGPQFLFQIIDFEDTNLWRIDHIDDERQRLVARFSDYGLTTPSDKVNITINITDSGIAPQTSTATLTVEICKCNELGEANCAGYNAEEPPWLFPVIFLVFFIFFFCFCFAFVRNIK